MRHDALKQGKDVIGIILIMVSTMFPKIGTFPALVFLMHGSSGGLVILFGGIAPLKMLDSKYLEFLDAIPLSEEEQHGQTGPNKNGC